MKRVLESIIIIVILATGVSAKNLKPVSLYAGTGLGIPGGPGRFQEGWKNGFHVFGGIGYEILPRLQIGGYTGYLSFPYDLDQFVNSGAFPNSSTDDFEGRTYGALMFGFDARFNMTPPGGRARPYVQAGFGIADTDVDDLEYNGLTVRQGSGETKPYISLGGGVETTLGLKLTLFFQGQVVLIFYDDENSRIAEKTVTIFPISIGLKF